MEDKDIGSDSMNSESVEEWLEEIAEAEGRTREETLEDLVSSYWRLEEIFHLLQDTDIDLGYSRGSSDEIRPPEGSSLNELRQEVEHLSEEVESIETESAVSSDELNQAISELDSRVESVENGISDVSRELSEFADGPLAEPEELESRLSTLEKRLDRTETKVSKIGEELDEVDERVALVAESAVSTNRFEAHVDQAESVHGSMRRSQEAIQERVRSEFGNIRTVLTYLLDSLDREENLRSRPNHEQNPKIQDYLSDQEILASLLRRANREGLQSAACSQCGQSVDLSLLEEPSCPHCEQRFERLGTESRYWGLSRRDVLTTAEDVNEE